MPTVLYDWDDDKAATSGAFVEASSVGAEQKDVAVWLRENLLGEGGPTVVHLCGGPSRSCQARWEGRMVMHCASARQRFEADGGESWYEHPEVTPPATPKGKTRLGESPKSSTAPGPSGGGAKALDDPLTDPGLFDAGRDLP